MLKTVSIVSTQMQLVNSVEYIKTCVNAPAHHFLVVCTGSKNRRRQIDSLLKCPCYNQVFSQTEYISLASRPFFYLKEIICKYKLSRLFSDNFFDIIVAGNFLSIYHRYFQFVCGRKNRGAKYVFVDDGTATAESVPLRKKELTTGILQCLQFSRSVKFLYFTLDPSFKSFVPDSVSFFSVYKNLDFPKKDEFTTCEYSYTKQLRFEDSSKFDNLDVVIIGQPLVSAGIMRKDRYNEILNSFIKGVPNKRTIIAYVPHPSEDIQVSLEANTRNKCIIMRPSIPFELWLITHDIRCLVGYYSSALVNTHYLFPDLKIISLFPVEIQKSTDLFHEEARESYEYIKEIGIEVRSV